MAFNIWDLEEEPLNAGLKGKVIMFYSANSCGKTSVASRMPKAFLMSFEPGGAAIKCMKTNVKKWSDAKQIWNSLCSEKLVDDGEGNRVPEYELIQRDKVQTIVIDTVEAMEVTAIKAVCAAEGVSDISEIIGKKNGYTMYRSAIQTEINKLVSYGYTIVFIMHEQKVKKIDSKGNEYEFIQPKGWDKEKGSLRFVVDLCDFVFYIESNGVDEETGETILSSAYTKQCKRFFARSRFSEIPFKLDPFCAEGVEAVIKKAVEDTAAVEGAELEYTFSRQEDNKTAEEWIEDIKPIFKALHAHDATKTQNCVESVLGEGGKVTQCKDVRTLENLYNKLDTLRKDLGV